MAEILLDHNSGKSASAIWGKGTVQIWDSPKCTHQIAETAFPSIVVPPIRLISIVGPIEPPKQLDIRKEATIKWPTIK